MKCHSLWWRKNLIKIFRVLSSFSITFMMYSNCAKLHSDTSIFTGSSMGWNTFIINRACKFTFIFVIIKINKRNEISIITADNLIRKVWFNASAREKFTLFASISRYIFDKDRQDVSFSKWFYNKHSKQKYIII